MAHDPDCTCRICLEDSARDLCMCGAEWPDECVCGEIPQDSVSVTVEESGACNLAARSDCPF